MVTDDITLSGGMRLIMYEIARDSSFGLESKRNNMHVLVISCDCINFVSPKAVYILVLHKWFNKTISKLYTKNNIHTRWTPCSLTPVAVGYGNPVPSRFAF